MKRRKNRISDAGREAMATAGRKTAPHLNQRLAERRAAAAVLQTETREGLLARLGNADAAQAALVDSIVAARLAIAGFSARFLRGFCRIEEAEALTALLGAELRLLRALGLAAADGGSDGNAESRGQSALEEYLQKRAETPAPEPVAARTAPGEGEPRPVAERPALAAPASPGAIPGAPPDAEAEV